MATLRTEPVLVRVPATCANLGPGFDTFGLALDLYDSLAAMVSADAGVLIEVEGEGVEEVPRDASHLVVRAMALGFAAMQVRPEGFVLRCTNVIPHSRGLGSSAAAIIGGLALARAMVVEGDELLPDALLLQAALGLESHPDNLAAALYGGFTNAWLEGEGARSVRHEIHSMIMPIIAVPQFQVPTSQARNALTPMVSRQDATFNIARSALLVHALTSDPTVLFAATDDRIHQDSRRSVYPASMELLDDLRAQGLPAVISGAGPSVLIFGAAGEVDQVKSAAGESWRVSEQKVGTRGVYVDPVFAP
ncbi:MAG: homoserine kinase [Actinobacteria bacterium]|uniref:Homoserine kinase n=1 Tax=freshwater metagenome TaxID=449393 RepID=A0A6J7SP56_9ZZZZ|nr:homoserine kinase [Actinomycetota bacterium]MTB28446.1 homoserine kinase [Actinomycetota bacterium]